MADPDDLLRGVKEIAEELGMIRKALEEIAGNLQAIVGCDFIEHGPGKVPEKRHYLRVIDIERNIDRND